MIGGQWKKNGGHWRMIRGQWERNDWKALRVYPDLDYSIPITVFYNSNLFPTCYYVSCSLDLVFLSLPVYSTWMMAGSSFWGDSMKCRNFCVFESKYLHLWIEIFEPKSFQLWYNIFAFSNQNLCTFESKSVHLWIEILASIEWNYWHHWMGILASLNQNFFHLCIKIFASFGFFPGKEVEGMWLWYVPGNILCG